MPESIVQVTEGTGKKLHTWQRTIGANNVEDEVVIEGEHYVASYSVAVSALSTTTANDHLVQLMAGASLNVRVKRVTITQRTNAGALSVGEFALVRLTTAGSGGTAVTPAKFDNADAASGATAMTIPTVKGTEGTTLFIASRVLRAAADPGETPWEWTYLTGMKPIIIPAGAANGLAVKNVLGVATSTVDVVIEFTESSFL